MNRIVILLLLVFTFSCSTQLISVEPRMRTLDLRDINFQYTEEIVRALYVSEVNIFEVEQVQIERISQFKIGGVTWPYSNGTLIPLESENEKYLFYYKDSYRGNGEGYTIGIVKDKNTRQLFPFLIKLGALSIAEFPPNTELKENTKIYTPEHCNDCFMQEFVYTGRSGSTLNFLYREYSGNLLRASFSQQLEYDLKEGNVVGFNGLRIEVVDATNTEITYKILQKMD